jgi:hypothetical protein
MIGHHPAPPGMLMSGSFPDKGCRQRRLWALGQAVTRTGSTMGRKHTAGMSDVCAFPTVPRRSRLVFCVSACSVKELCSYSCILCYVRVTPTSRSRSRETAMVSPSLLFLASLHPPLPPSPPVGIDDGTSQASPAHHEPQCRRRPRRQRSRPFGKEGESPHSLVVPCSIRESSSVVCSSTPPPSTPVQRALR